ncbi:MAG: hypothetical protein Q7S12_02950, partial [bacterium]|nr:hypothetical protein [bacterium]
MKVVILFAICLITFLFLNPLLAPTAHASFGTFIESIFNSIFDFFFGVDPLPAPTPVPTPSPAESGKTLGVPSTPSVEEDESTSTPPVPSPV